MLSYSMKDFWNMVVNFMNQCWDKSLDFLSKLNAWIPLSAVLIAGAGLVALVLILALCGCAVRKCLIPHWLIWTYFAFAVIIIFAHTGNNLAAIVSAIEIPFLIVLVCYILRALFRRRPRYTYVEKTVYARELAKGRVYCVKNGLKNQNVKNDEVKELKEIKKVDKKLESEVAQVSETESHTEAVVEDEIVSNDAEIAKMEADAEAAKLAAAEQAAREAHEQEKAQRAAELAAQEAEQAAREALRQQSNRVDKNDFYNVKTVKTEAPQTTSAFTTVDLPTVQPIPDKSYEPTREPTIVTKPVSQRIPDLRISNTNVQSRSNNVAVNRPSATTSTSAFGRTVTTQTNTTPTATNTYTSMYNPRIVKTTTTTATTNNSPLSSVTTNRTVNSNPVSSTTTKVTSNGTTPHSTDDIMAAIERLRASMKK